MSTASIVTVMDSDTSFISEISNEDGNQEVLKANEPLEFIEGNFQEGNNSLSDLQLIRVIVPSPVDNTNTNVSVPKNCNQGINEYTWESFKIPWDKLPQFMLTPFENGTADKRMVSEAVHTIVNEMRNIKCVIPTKAFKTVAKKMAGKYPKMFLDVDEDGNVLVNGTTGLMSKLLDRNCYLNRPHKRQNDDFQKPSVPPKKLKEINNRKAGCINYNPEVSTSSKNVDAKTLLNNIGPDHSQCFSLLEETFPAQRNFLTTINPPTIEEVRKEWPVLFKKDAITWHFQRLTEKDSPINEPKYKKIVAYGKKTKMTIIETDDIVLKALNVFTKFFKEDISSFFYKIQVSQGKINSI